MDMQKVGALIRGMRKQRGWSQQALGMKLNVTDKAVSKWERGLACPDIETLKNLSLRFGCSIADILDGRLSAAEAQCLSVKESGCAAEADMKEAACDVEVVLDLDGARFVSPLLFGDNLEHTRAGINGGLSAQMLKNRKFVGKPGRYGCANGWYAIGQKSYFFFRTADDGAGDMPYTRHAEGYKMKRVHECNAQGMTNYKASRTGIGQKELYVKAGAEYEFAIVAKADRETKMTAQLIGSDKKVMDSAVFTVKNGDYERVSCLLKADREDAEAKLEITFETVGTVIIGAVSLMPKENFRGMRLDVIECMKELGIRLLRWPGGNFAGEYNWKDGLLPRDMRAPLQSYLWLETQPHTLGYDFHEINVDDFTALCREIGAEPFITINPTWNTPEESAQWVEYCNGSEKTPYGKLRARNGSKEPYNVQFWSLGNEAGYGHMEGANTAEVYAKVVREHADKMLEASPGLTLCSSGPYPNAEWAKLSAKKLSDIVPMVSLHSYTPYPQYMDESKRRQEYEAFIAAVNSNGLSLIRELRAQLGDAPVHISFDEWNAWYAWYRIGSVTEGIFAAAFLNMLMRSADAYGIGMACHFESVNEGAIMVHPECAELAPAGQVFSLMKQHANGMIAALEQDVTATCKEEEVTCTLLNRAFEQEKKFVLRNAAELLEARVYTAEDVVPGTVFEKSELTVRMEDGAAVVVLPPHSVAQLRFSMPA